MEGILPVIFVCYYLLIIGLMAGWRKSMRYTPAASTAGESMISVVIPARNEQQVIGHLLNDLQQQHYRNFEVIVINDHSTDGTYEVVAKYAKRDANIKIINCDSPGKKFALSEAIDIARGDIIVTTDADCNLTPHWLEIINLYFQNRSVEMLFGGVKMKGNGSLFSDLQGMEFCSLIGSGAATLALGFPTMCNGANLAFRKSVFKMVEGYTGNVHIPSGDDEFLLRKVFKKYPNGICFVNHRKAIVTTSPQPNWKAFVNQRIRWAGKWKYHSDIRSTSLAIFIFLFQCSTILIPLFIFQGWISSSTAGLLWGVKVFLEFLFLRMISNFLASRWRWGAFMLLQVVYPFYVLGIGLISNFHSFEWKERRLRSNEEKTR